MIRIESPNLVFLACKDARVGKALAHKLPVAITRAFATPIYDAVTGMFYLYAPGILIDEPPAELPYPPKDPALLFPKVEATMKAHFGDHLLAEMMCEHIRMETAYCETLIITDSMGRWDEILYVAQRVGKERCVHAHVGKHAATRHVVWTHGVRDIHFPMPDDSSFDREMDNLALELAPPQSPQPAVAPQQLRVVQ